MKPFMLFTALLLLVTACKKEETPDNNNPGEPAQVWPEKCAALANLFEGEGVGAACNLSDDVVVLFNLDGSRFAWLADSEIKFVGNVDAETSPFAESPVGHIGATTIINGDRFYVYDLDGENYIGSDLSSDSTEGWMNPDLLDWDGGTSQTYQWGNDGTIPFGTIGCMWNFSNTGNDCFDASQENNYTWMVNANGDEVVRYYTTGTFGSAEAIDHWTAENNCGGPDGLLPFEAIGAACRVVYPNMIQEVFFNLDGTQMCYYNVSEGIFSDVYDLD